MEQTSHLISAVAELLWPALLLVLLIYFGPMIKSIVASLGKRKFTINVAGTELTVEEAAEQQRRLIGDLQEKVLKISEPRALARAAVAEPGTSYAVHNKLQRLLWVDDYPSNNAQIVAQLRDKGVQVDMALSTNEGARMFATNRYDAVISDMGRHEDGHNVADAGVRLIRELRQSDATIPMVIFCSNRGARVHGSEALKAGATAVTSSALELLSNIGSLE
jgi:CheY-like chemotaxis protein